MPVLSLTAVAFADSASGNRPMPAAMDGDGLRQHPVLQGGKIAGPELDEMERPRFGLAMPKARNPLGPAMEVPKFGKGWKFYDSAPNAEAAMSGPSQQTESPKGARRSLPRVLVQPGEKTALDGDFLIVAAGPVMMPSYEGSNDQVIKPGLAVAGRIKGIGISPRAGGMALDLIKDKPGARLSFSFGPAVRLRLNRTGTIKDPVVAQLGKLKPVFEAGVTAGVTVRRVFNPHDQLSLGGDLRWDVSGKGSGKVAVASASYLTPISKAQVVAVLASAEFGDDRYARYNYGITAAGSLASGLPAYTAKGGLKALNIGVVTGRDLSGNLLDGGLAIAIGAMYTRLTGSAAATPITRIRGNRNQWTAAVGLSYTF